MSTQRFNATPDDLAEHEVVVAAGNTASDVYHTVKCGRYPTKPKAMDRTTAEAWGREKCSLCETEESND